MKCQCPGCQVTFSVPDEKIPAGKTLKILCPKCRIPVEIGGTSEAGGADGKPRTPAASALESQRTDDSLLDMVEEGRRTVLLCTTDPARSRSLEQVLRELEYYVIQAPKVAIAIGKLRLNRYDMVLLDETFEGGTSAENVLLQHIQLLPMHVRRNFFMCLLSQDLPTHDRMLAFRLGVDMILNLRDVSKIKLLLVNAVKDHKTFYRVYNDELSRKG